jgi:hypothetical protein
MRVRLLSAYINKNHKNYQHTNQILNNIFTKHFFTVLLLLKIKKRCHRCQNHVQNTKLSTTLQPCDIYVRLKILQTIWQPYADQEENIFIAKLAANGEDYSLMWTKVELYSRWKCTDIRLQQ